MYDFTRRGKQILNTDRFLTRVWDAEEKRMIYKHKAFIYDKVMYAFEGVSNDAIIASKGNHIVIIEPENRFIMMQCLGLPDKKKKLIYGGDIVATSNNKYLVYWDEESAAFWFKRLDNECELLIFDFNCSCEIEIIGNQFEHPELLEERQ